MHVIIEPQALDITDPAAPVPLTSVPPGSYAVYLVQLSGQTWRVPNELAPILTTLTGFGVQGVASQGFAVVVPDAG